MLTDLQIEENKQRFIDLVRGITRPNCDIEGLLKKLEAKGFFTAPASSIYHSSFKGGLCYHSLNVYDTLEKLVEMTWPDIPFPIIDEDSIRLTTLFHDAFDKVDKYEEVVRNKKVYCEDGDKYDELGKFKWVPERGYAKKEANKTYIFGTHGQNAERLLSYYVPLTEEESCAIVNHHGGFEYPSHILDISAIYTKYSLACLLSLADQYATYILEKKA